MRELLRRNRARFAAAALAALAVGLLAWQLVCSVRGGLPRPLYPTDLAARYAPLLQHLPARGTVWYVADPAVLEGLRRQDPHVIQRVAFEALLSQLALAPLHCDMHRPHPYLVTNFSEGSPPPADDWVPGYEVVAAGHRGTFLLRQKEPR